MSKVAKKRTPISGPRQTGTVVDWKGAFGWIEPSKPIKHPNAHMKGGKVYLGAEDVTEELDGIGAIVNFTLYSDSTGLGASDCKAGASGASYAKPGSKAGANLDASGKLATSSAVAAYKAANSPSAKLAAQKAAAKARAAPVNQRVAAKPGANLTASGKFAASSAVAAYKAANTPAAKAAVAKTTKSVQQTAWKKQPSAPSAPVWKKTAQGGGEGGGWKAQQKKEGSREMLHDEFLIGTISAWRGKFGWVKPDDEIDHPDMDKHKGDLYLKQEDVEEEIEGVGARVQFMLYSDGMGLGAANVTPAQE